MSLEFEELMKKLENPAYIDKISICKSEIVYERDYGQDWEDENKKKAYVTEGENMLEKLLQTNPFFLSRASKPREHFHSFIQACDELAQQTEAVMLVEFYPNSNQAIVSLASSALVLNFKELINLQTVMFAVDSMALVPPSLGGDTGQIVLEFTFSEKSLSMLNVLSESYNK